VKKFGLPKASLLRKPGEFRRVYQQGRRVKGTGFTLIFLAGNQPGSRLGISIHRMLRGAVRRNRIKRMVREVFRLNRDLFPRASDIVITVGPNFRLSTAGSVRKAVAGLTGRYQAEQT
jgi:ribonuclease P protein component